VAEPDVDGVVITGVFGAGKSALAAEVAGILEDHGVAYAAIDLDWLLWFDVPGTDEPTRRRTYLANVADVVRNERAVGVRRFVLAIALRDREDLDALAAAAGLRLRVVRLDVPLADITARLADDPTSGRGDDLAATARWLRDGTGIGFEDLTIANTGPVGPTARAVVDWLGWLP
jgi:hypothetical protein